LVSRDFTNPDQIVSASTLSGFGTGEIVRRFRTAPAKEPVCHRAQNGALDRPHLENV
jgi:hypothetical protein